ncbi:MAG: thioredoxin family protein [Sulfolobaceae archaeon]
MSELDKILEEISKKLEEKSKLFDNTKRENILIKVDSNNFEQIIKNNKIVVLDFWAEWCAPCHLYEPIFRRVAEKFKDNKNIVFGRVNVDENTSLADALNVLNIPTTIIFLNGEPKDYLVGAVDEETLEKHIRDLIN